MFKGLFESKHDAIVNKGKSIMIKRNEKLKAFYNKYKDEVSEKRQNEILALTASELCVKLKQRKITSREIVITYGLRISTIGVDLFILADTDLDKALSDADNADQVIKDTKDPNDLPALIGLPISIKDHIRVKDLISSVGMLANSFDTEKLNSYVVDILLLKGAVVLCKGNVPQGLLAIESSNRVYGISENPWNRKRTPGGSSGGEAAIIASKCAPIGIGSDIGGSIRNPANFCGIYGFKPTNYKISNYNIKSMNGKTRGFDRIIPSTGPISTSIDDIVLILSALYGEFSCDYSCHQSKFDLKLYNNYIDSVKNNKKLRIGYSYNAERVELAEGITSEIKNTIDKLKKEGHELIEFPYNDYLDVHDKGLEIMFNSDSIPTLLRSLKDEDPMDYYKSVCLVSKAPFWIFGMLESYLRVSGQGRFADNMSKLVRYNSPKEYFDACAEFFDIKAKFYQKYREMNIDCLILPVQPFPALFNGSSDISSQNVFYTMTLNYLNMPSGSIPLGLLKDTRYITKYKDKLADIIEDSVNHSLNLPIGIQVATLPLEDEKCVAMMKIIDDVVRKSKEKEYKDYISSDSCTKEYKELLKGFLLQMNNNN